MTQSRTHAAILSMLLLGIVTSGTASQTCAELSSEVTRLTAKKHALQRSFWDVPGTRVAAIGATTFTPVVYPAVAYLAIAAAARAPDPSERQALQLQIDVLRDELAKAQCYLEPLYHY